MRFRIHAIANAECTRINPEVLDETDDELMTQAIADVRSDFPFGTAVLDTVTGRVDWGFGFVGLPDNVVKLLGRPNLFD